MASARHFQWCGVDEEWVEEPGSFSFSGTGQEPVVTAAVKDGAERMIAAFKARGHRMPRDFAERYVALKFRIN